MQTAWRNGDFWWCCFWPSAWARFRIRFDAVAMPQQSMLSGLLLFNLGVELGQITVLLFAYLGVGWLRRRSFYKTRIAEPASMTIAGVGLYWLIKRLAF